METRSLAGISTRLFAQLADPLDGGGYPALYQDTNSASLAGQNDYLNALRMRLGGLLFATLGAAIFFTLQLPGVAGWSALIGFVVALCAEIFTAVSKPERRWYEGRAAAESAKTLAWRYAVGGEKFEIDMAEVDVAFIKALRSILSDLNDIQLEGVVDASDQITPKMREIRSKPFEERRNLFAEGRIEDQRAWYSRKSQWNRKRQRRWTTAVIAAEGLGILGGAATIAYSLSIDLLGILAALAATITAWVQAKQHSTLATAYGITAQELASIHSELASVDASAWANFVGQSEEAISREHTLWRASRGVQHGRA